ncbi:unnamed protein product [Prorocentrum cordatum]|uniref:TFIIS central domain-containing protein n=1 Tax=Prorocentrum cordatum TaxID=2364126 RepID=A0ABN9XD08_9DINO|nr:unnamed protein product [Polarella glacialis]
MARTLRARGWKRSDAAAPRKSKTSGGKAIKGKGVKYERCQSAYVFFCKYGCAAVLRNCSGTKLGEASRMMSEAWRKLQAADRATYEVGAKLNRSRRDIERLQARTTHDAQNVSAKVKETVSALMSLHYTTPTWVGCLAEEAITAMEALDRRMYPEVRALIGASFSTAISAPAAAAAMRRALGGHQGERLWALLRRWTSTRAAPAVAAEGAEAHGPGKRAPIKAAATSAVVVEMLTEDVRQRVVGALVRTCASGTGRASIDTCRGIERELFTRFGSAPKEYRLRARSLLFNLRAADGVLLGRVLAQTLPPSELVGLGTEEFANDALKAQRKVERERYFRSEVHLAHGLQHRKRRCSSLELRTGDAAEQAADEPIADTSGPGGPHRLLKRRWSAEQRADGATAEHGAGSGGACSGGAGPSSVAGGGTRSLQRRRSSAEPRAAIAAARRAVEVPDAFPAGGAGRKADASSPSSGLSCGSSDSDSESDSMNGSLNGSSISGSSCSGSDHASSVAEKLSAAIQQVPSSGHKRILTGI